MNQKATWAPYVMGTCYYPEHWPKELWAEDLDRMLAVGITQIRIGEFAWTLVEPEEGTFTDAFFRPFLDLCTEKGMKVVFGTPTATPPAWLTEKYPDVLNAREDGVLYRHGCRRHYNYNSEIYREKSAAVTEFLGNAYGSHPAIVGWQIDNELNCETDEFHSQADDRAFRRYLKEKFKTLDALNDALGTVFWNETYTDWEQVHLPQTIVSDGHNPHLMLEYSRFISESAIAFCKMQADILRKVVKPGDFITTNGLFGNLDNAKMTAEALDVYTFDSYPDFGFALGTHPDVKDPPDQYTAGILSEVRGVCPHFGIMEQQSGANGWVTRMEAPSPRPGQLNLWAMQSVAYGADLVSFFRWRTACFGTEMYWHGILDHDNRDNRKLREVKAFGEDLRKIGTIAGADFKAAFAVARDYDNDSDQRADTRHRMVAQRSASGILRASVKTNRPFDTVFIDHAGAEELKKYPLVFLPHDMIVTEERVELLKEYVVAGGTLVIGCCSGTKDGFGRCPILPEPGLLLELTGADVTDFTFTSPAEPDVTAELDGKSIPAPLFNEILSARGDTRVLARYQGSYYCGEPALTENRIGQGRVLYWGSTFDEETANALLDYAGVKSPAGEMAEAGNGVTLILREKGGKQYLFALNYLTEERTVKLKKPARLMTGEGGETDSLTLKPYGTAVFEIL